MNDGEQPGLDPLSTSSMSWNDYDSFAEGYSAENENNLLNGLLRAARDHWPSPETSPAAGSWTPAAAQAHCSLACATGVPVVTGIDASAGMLDAGPTAAR